MTEAKELGRNRRKNPPEKKSMAKTLCPLSLICEICEICGFKFGSEVVRYSLRVSKILLSARACTFQVELLFQARFSMWQIAIDILKLRVILS